MVWSLLCSFQVSLRGALVTRYKVAIKYRKRHIIVSRALTHINQPLTTWLSVLPDWEHCVTVAYSVTRLQCHLSTAMWYYAELT